MTTNSNLSRSVAKGVAWMLGLRISIRVLGLLSTVILARLLTPEDFGIVAIAMSFFALLILIKDFGFDTVIIQMKKPEKRHYDTAWTFNLVFGVFLAIVLYVLSGYIADLYKTPDLEQLLWAISCLFVIGGVESVGTLDFRKNLTFEKEFALKILPKIIGVPCTILSAYWLKSYWALTIGTIITQLASLFAGYYMHSYRPKFELKAASELFSFSKWLMLNNLINFINNRSSTMLIGRMINPYGAGLYSIASEIGTMITTEFSAAVSRASYPGYAKLSDNLPELKKLYLTVLNHNSLLLFPLAFGFYSVAELIIPIFLGNQWLETIPIVKIIAISGLLMAINSNSGYVFLAIGNPRMSTILGFIRIVIFLPLLVYLITSLGIMGAAWAVLITTIIMFFITNIVVIKYLPVLVQDLFGAFLRPLLSSIIMALAIYSYGIDGNKSMLENIYQLLVCILLGSFVYFLTVYLLWLVMGKQKGAEEKLFSLIKLKLTI